MTQYEGAGAPQEEGPLSFAEVKRIEDEMVWPALDYLWSGRVRDTFLPGSSLRKTSLLYTDDGVMTKFVLDLDSLVGEDGDNYAWFKLSAEKIVEDPLSENLMQACIDDKINQELAKTAVTGTRIDRELLESEVGEEIKEEDLEAYEVTSFEFQLDPAESMTVVHRFELRDSPTQDVSWASDEVGGLPEAFVDEEPEDSLFEIMESYAVSFKPADIQLLRQAFRALGVPEFIVGSV